MGKSTRSEVRKLMRNLKDHKLISDSLESLSSMSIPWQLVEDKRIIECAETFLYDARHWQLAMELIRRLENEKATGGKSIAPKLDESIETKRIWREARLRRKEDLDWLRDLLSGKEKENYKPAGETSQLKKYKKSKNSGRGGQRNRSKWRNRHRNY